MKVLSLYQYMYLRGIERQDRKMVEEAADRLPDALEMKRTGYYIADLGSRPGYILWSTMQLTSLGKQAIICYEALHAHLDMGT